MDADVSECRNQVERQILSLESRTLVKLTEIESDMKNVKRDIDELVTRPEFHPVAMITYGLAGGVLIAALGAVLTKVIGW